MQEAMMKVGLHIEERCECVLIFLKYEHRMVISFGFSLVIVVTVLSRMI